MSALRPSAYAVLGWIAIEPMSGYDVRQRIRTSVGLFWNESFGSIYPTLQRLQDDGLTELVPGGDGDHPSRKVYAATAAGREALRSWLAIGPAATHSRNEFALKLFFGSMTDPAAIRAHVEEHLAEHQIALEELRATVARLESELGTDDSIPYRLLTARLGVALCETTVRWCEEARTTLDP